jgi:hypothetical protein
MSTLSNMKSRRGGSTSGPAASERASLHDLDLYSWVGEQVALLRAGRGADIDYENIAEELSDVGEEQYNRLESALSVLLQHMLKWDHQPKLRSRSWVNSILEHRDQAARQPQRNPGLKSRRSEAVASGYKRGRYRASTETDLDLDAFPATCPYSWTEIMTRDFTWPRSAAKKR